MVMVVVMVIIGYSNHNKVFMLASAPSLLIAVSIVALQWLGDDMSGATNFESRTLDADS